jgi:hypothetical protein
MLQADQGIVFGVGALSGFIYNSGSFTVYGDYVFHPHLLTSSDQFALTWYVGGGVQIMLPAGRFDRPVFVGIPYYYTPAPIWLAARVPIGLNIALAQSPFEIYLEAVPGILVFPAITFGLGASLGGRFYF